ncbi:MAG: chaperone NapD [Gammaproteobacteria bacterium]|uniref:Chaperone NapD n=1 Tax=Candidatus Thiopontia autotrophica TaxID=2841688 RepID=A0A8J6PEV0_9GAMM|nr:chaperone NapD [Candidatus Thiopontia autotrophica]MBL6968597.1 chaperone NapD [Gammaproteobacteria bacterium]
MEDTVIQISGVAIRLRPEMMESVKSQLNAIDGLEIHAEDAAGKLAITLEGRDANTMTDSITEIESIDGVIIVNPVYIHDETEIAEAS